MQSYKKYVNEISWRLVGKVVKMEYDDGAHIYTRAQRKT